MQSATETAATLDRTMEIAIDRLKWARGFTETLIEGVPDEQLTYRVGGKGNHALWVMGHLAVIDDRILSTLTGSPRELPERYYELFAPGSQPSGDAKDYPSRSELAELMRAGRRRLLAWVGTFDEETGGTPTPEPMRRFAPDWISLAFSMASHDMLHAGQVAAVRTALGLPRLIR